MTDSEGPTPAPGSGAAEAGPRQLAQDWIVLVQSELSALAADREAAETWQALLAIWAGSAASMLPRAGVHDPRAADAPRPAPAAAAPDPRDAEIERLDDRVAELERRLAAIERAAANPGGGAGTG